MSQKILLALPSKGRLMEKTQELFMQAGLPILRGDTVREYRAVLREIPQIEIVFLSAQESVIALRDGAVDMAVSGEDLLHETLEEPEKTCQTMLKLGFGQTDVVVAVPRCWMDVATMADLEEVAIAFHARHRRRLRVATKYISLTRRWFLEMGISGYRSVESLGATEGTPAAGTAEVVVDITTTGATLRANGLKILDDGLILRSEAALFVRQHVCDHPVVRTLLERLTTVL